MPKPVGFSEHTADKQAALGAYCDVLFAIIAGILRKSPRVHQEAIFTDLNAGTGRVGNQDGSSLIIVRHAFVKRLPFHLWACELYEERADELHENLLDLIRTLWSLHRAGAREHAGGVCPTGRCPACDPLAADAWVEQHVTFVVGDHKQTVDGIIADIRRRTRGATSVYGLTYADGNGQVDHPIGPLIKLSAEPRLHRVDMLVHVNAAVIKRTRIYGQTEQGARTKMGAYANTFLMEGGVDEIDKGFRLVRRPRGQQQWTFFALSNWDAFPKLRRLGFLDAGTDDGRRVIAELDLAPTERPTGQLPFDPDLFTLPMPSISAIPATERSDPASSPDAAVSASDAAANE